MIHDREVLCCVSCDKVYDAVTGEIIPLSEWVGAVLNAPLVNACMHCIGEGDKQTTVIPTLEKRGSLRGVQDAGAQLNRLVQDLEGDQEHLWVWSLDVGFNIIAVDVVNIGSVHCVDVCQRSVFRQAMKHGAVYIVVGHNHTDCKDLWPSAEDYDASRNLATAGDYVQIPVVAHLISNGRDYVCVCVR